MSREEELGPATQKIGTHQHFRWLKGIIVAVLCLNLLDAVLTIFAVETGRATEANPLMKPLVHESPVVFLIVKTMLVLLGCFLLWRLRKRPFAVFSIFLAFLVYYGIVIYHLRALDLNLLSRLINAV
jgi:hypothetical protein